MNATHFREARFYISLSIAAAVATITLKLFAWWISGSVGLLSDALESFVNLVGASFALWMIQIASTPPDADHPYGHSKAEYFSSGFEGMLIFAAAALILWTAIPRLFAPTPLESLGIGLWLSAASTALNFMVSRLLSRAGQRLRSVALEADARHLMTDVWTTLGVIVGLIAVALTGWLWLDALIAIGVALHILFEGWKLMRAATAGLMDESLPGEDLASIETVLEDFRAQGASFLQLKTRQAGSTRFVHVTVQVPGDWHVDVAHDLLDKVEARIAEALQGAQVSTHLEPLRSA
ncbi:cation diffusion facilitator family transporter [Viridibacterium curvum]